jgi:hypothetical protein
MTRCAALAAIILACLLSPAWASPFAHLDRQAAKALTDPARYSVPTIVALWSSDCGHCKKNLELFVRMLKAEPRLRLITVATEADFDGLAVPLDRLQVPGQRYAYGTDAPEALAFALDPRWRGELPRTLFFDGLGGKTAVSGVVDEAAVKNLLKVDGGQRR